MMKQSVKDVAVTTVKRRQPTVRGDTECEMATKALRDERGEPGRFCAFCKDAVYGRSCVGVQGPFRRVCEMRVMEECEVHVVGVCLDCMEMLPDAMGGMMIELGCGCEMDTECSFEM
jgi:hypothetical protein